MRKCQEILYDSPRSEAMISHDFQADILSRLPAKTLCKFKCVSKQWLGIITNPYFVNMHRIRCMQNPPLLLNSSALFQDQSNTEHKDHYNFHFSTTDNNERLYGEFNGEFNEVSDGRRYFLVSCNNLICLVTTKHIYIGNPSIQQLSRLPVSSHWHPPKHIGVVGFGYLPTINTYKIVHIYSLEVSPHQMEVFTLTDGGGGVHWRLIGECPDPVFPFMSSVSANGAIYWIAWDQEVGPSKWTILVFDLEQESHHVISYPGCIDSHLFDSLVELKGCLCVTNWKSTPGRVWSQPLVMDIWMLKDHKTHIRIREDKIDFYHIYRVIPSDEKYGQVLINSHNDYLHSIPLDEEDGEVLIDSQRDYLYYYNIDGKYFRSVRKLNSEGYNRSSCLYFDGLFSLKSEIDAGLSQSITCEFKNLCRKKLLP